MLKIQLIHTPPMQSIIKLGAQIFKKYPKIIWGLRFYKRARRPMNLTTPSTLYEKMIQSYLRADHEKLACLADKYEVRQYVTDKIGAKYLNELYGVYEQPLEIEFDKLPQSFVLKTTNGCATNIIVPDKRRISPPEIIEKLSDWLNAPYGELTGQIHYTKIKPRVISECFLKQNSTSTALVDYKFYCIYGRVEFMLACLNRESGTHVYDAIICNRQGEFCPEYSAHRLGEEFQYQIPVSFREMLNLSELLANGFPFVRVDFFEVEGHPIFGEMTFTPGLDYHPSAFEQAMLHIWEEREKTNYS